METNINNALMRCCSSDVYHHELETPHYFKMPNDQLVLFASDCHVLFVVKDTAGLLDTFDYDVAERPNIAMAIPTDACTQTLNVQSLAAAIAEMHRSGWQANETAISIDGEPFMADMVERIVDVLADLDLTDTVPMTICRQHYFNTLKIETDRYLIVQAGIVAGHQFYKHCLVAESFSQHLTPNT